MNIKKKTLLSIGSIATIALPIATTVSCTTTWTEWTKNDSEQTHVQFIRTHAAPIHWKVRSDSELMNAYDSVLNTLDISKINNQFELVKILTKIISISSANNIDTYWNNYPSMKTYLNGIVKKLDLKIKYNGITQTINWDVQSIIQNAINGIDSYSPHLDSSGYDDNKAFDVEKKGLLTNGMPVQLTKVALVGAPLTAIPIVSDLMALDGPFSLLLSKLVNLPKTTFSEFTNLLKNINKFVNDVWTAIETTTFVIDKGIDFTVGVSGKIGTYHFKPKTILNGQFFIQAFKH